MHQVGQMSSSYHTTSKTTAAEIPAMISVRWGIDGRTDGTSGFNGGPFPSLPRPTGHVCEQPVCDDGDGQPQQPGRGRGPAAAGSGPGVDQHLPPVLRDVHHIQEVGYETRSVL